MTIADVNTALIEYLKWAIGKGGVAGLIDSCSKTEMSKFVVDTLTSIQEIVDPKKTETEEEVDAPEETTPSA